jgi:hypothetical protein
LSHSILLLLLLLSTHSLIGWILQDSLICWLTILSIFVLPTDFRDKQAKHSTEEEIS